MVRASAARVQIEAVLMDDCTLHTRPRRLRFDNVACTNSPVTDKDKIIARMGASRAYDTVGKQKRPDRFF